MGGYKLVSHYYNRVPNGPLHQQSQEGLRTEEPAPSISSAAWPATSSPTPWQTDTCIGGWHYKKGQKYKTGKNVVDLMCDIVSRNGNLMLNVPLPNSGKPDDEELKTVEEITKWMAVNSEGVLSTRPWKIAGSAARRPPETTPSTSATAKTSRPPTSATPRRTARYTPSLWAGPHEAVVPTLALGGKNQVGKIRSLELLGHRGKLKFTQDEQSLRVMLPPEKPSDHAICFKIVGA